MPLYEYKCANCTNVFDVLAKMGQAPAVADCSACDEGSGSGVRVYGAGVAIHTGSSSSSFDDFDMGDMGGMGMPDMGGMGGHDHGHGHSHDDFGMGDFGMDDF